MKCSRPGRLRELRDRPALPATNLQLRTSAVALPRNRTIRDHFFRGGTKEDKEVRFCAAGYGESTKVKFIVAVSLPVVFAFPSRLRGLSQLAVCAILPVIA